MSTLVAYFSRKGENYFDGNVRRIEKGNTEVVAEKIAELTGGRLFEVVPLTPYSSDYEVCVEESKEDKAKNSRPEIVGCIESIDEYKTIYLGYPNYWGTMPMAMFTFLEKFDFKDKVIMPFCTHEGSGLGNSLDDIRRICEGAEVRAGFSVSGSAVYEIDEATIKAWIG